MFGMFQKKPPVGPDYSAVDSREKAQAMVERGELAKLLLLPAAFGGSDVQANVSYVPPVVVDIKSSFDSNVVMALARSGKISRYEARPAYQGKSVVPVSITIIATDPGTITDVIRIWGSGLVER